MYGIAAYDALNTGLFGGLLHRLGESDRGAEVIAAMTGAITIGMAMYYLVTEEPDAAIEWYLRDIDERRPNAPMIAAAAFTRPLRAHWRWPEAARRMNLPDITS